MNHFDRRHFLLTATGTALTLASSSRAIAGTAGNAEDTVQDAQPNWHSVEDWGVEGKAFNDTEKFYDRLPARAIDTVRKPVWDLSRHAAGMMVRFNTDSSKIQVRYKLANASLAMPHMPASGVSGVDLYSKDDEDNWRWAAMIKPQTQEVNTNLLTNIQPKRDGSPREYQMYLPLYNGLTDLEIGLDAKSKFAGVQPRVEKPVLFYGTSIMHGACASRTGMAIPAILGRRLNRPTINLGFSGNGKMEKEVGEFLCELDPAVYVIDCLPNMNGPMVTERCEPLVEQLRAARPDTPILLVEDRVNTSAWIRKNAAQHHATNRKALKSAYDRLVASGQKQIYYLGHEHLLGTDGEGATDGSHPNDMGMVRYADAYEPVLKRILSH
ncbi:MAG: hypothetical protein ACI87E_004712 [Mariniblastus sp.]|jgi:hypothetical protein